MPEGSPNQKNLSEEEKELAAAMEENLRAGELAEPDPAAPEITGDVSYEQPEAAVGTVPEPAPAEGGAQPEAQAPEVEAARGTPENAAIRNIMASVSPENQGFLNKMSERGREIAIQACEAAGLDGISAFKTTVGKLGVAYNQFWLHRHAGKAADRKREMDMYDLQTGALDKARGQMSVLVEKFTKQGTPGSEAIALKLNDIDRQKAALLEKKDKAQSKFESRDNKVKLYANERDRIADKLIGRYDEKLAPIEMALEGLADRQNEVDLTIAVTEAKHQNELAELSRQEQDIKALEESLRASGTTDGQIRKFVEPLMEQVAQNRAAIREEKDRLAKQKAGIDEKIARADRRANPYRDKREKFVRVKEGRPLEMEAEERTRGSGNTDAEDVRAHLRTERPETEGAAGAGGGAPLEASAAEESIEEGEREPALSEWIAGWKAYLEKQPDKKDLPPFDPSDEKRFAAEMTKRNFPQNSRLNPKSFEKVLANYYKLRKLPKNQFAGAYATFIKTLP